MVTLAGVLAACGSSEEAAPLRIGLLLSLGDEPSTVDIAQQQIVYLAAEHVNEGGGVFGRPVELVVGDTFSPAGAVEEARRLVEDEGVHALFGPGFSADALTVIAEVAAPLGIPVVSSSATSPLLTAAADGDFFFRTVLSDIAQGPVLARLTSDLGYSSVGVIYRDDAWGRGLSEAFLDAWDGDATAVAVDAGESSYLVALEESMQDEPDALVLLTFPPEGRVIMGEALDAGLFERFVFGGGVKDPDFVTEVGIEQLAGTYGVASGHQRGTASAIAWQETAAAANGEVADLIYLRESYDAVIAIALAAQAADSTHGAAIRDQLRAVTDAPGETVIAGPAGIARALAVLAGGGEIDYDGASGPLGWDGNGDLRRGTVGIWRIAADGAIEDVEMVPYPN